MLDPSDLDLDQIASALQDQTAYDVRWLVDPRSGEVVLWTSDLGIDGEHPIDLEEVGDLVLIDPLPSRVWYRDMVDFAGAVDDPRARDRLLRALDGKGAFRRFKTELHQHHPDLVSAWHDFKDGRAQRRAVDWLVSEGLVAPETAARFAG